MEELLVLCVLFERLCLQYQEGCVLSNRFIVPYVFWKLFAWFSTEANYFLEPPTIRELLNFKNIRISHYFFVAVPDVVYH